VVHEPTEKNVATPVEPNSIEPALKTLWDKARRVAEVIARLKLENSELRASLSQVQDAVVQLRTELTRKEELITRLNSEKVAAPSTQDAFFSNGERQELSAKVKELLERIESYL
jgi:chromosome segregation ATPase